MAAESTSPPPPAAPAKKPRRWLRVLLVLLALAALLGLWLAGPGGRFIGSHVLRGQLEKAGLSGDFTIRSIGADGVTLGNVDLEGPGLVRSIRGESLKVEYRIDELRRGKIRAFDGSNLEVELDLDAAPKRNEDPTTPFDANALGETLRAVQKKLGPVALNGSNVSLNVVRGKQAVATIKGADIHHVPNTDRFTLKFRTLTAVEQPPAGEPAPLAPEALPDESSLERPDALGLLVQDVTEKAIELIPGQEVEIIWSPAGLMIDRIEILPGMILENLKLDHVAGEPLRTETVVEIDAARVRVRLEDDLRNAHFELEKGPLDLARLLRQFDRDTVLAGSIESLDLTIDDLFKPQGQWQAAGTVGATVLRFREWTLDGVDLKLSKTPNSAALDLRASLLGTPFTLQGEAKLVPALANDPIRWWHDATVSGTLETQNLQPAVVKLWSDLIPEPLSVPVPQARLKLAFTTTLKGPLVELVAGDYTLEDVALDGRTLPPLGGHAEWDMAGLKVALTAAQFSAEGDGLALEGAWDFKTRAYRGGVRLDRYDLGPLSNFLPAYGINLPSGILSGSWQGGGLLGETPSHHGSLALNDTSLTFNDLPPVSGTLQGSYQWPESVEVTMLRAEQNGHTLAMAAAWKGGQLALSDITLTAGDSTLLSGSVNVPLGREVRSLDAFIAQQGAIAAALKANNLTLAQLHDLVAGLNLGAAGTLSGEVTLAGTLADPTAKAELAIRGLTATDLSGVPPMDVFAKLHHTDGRLAAESSIVQQDATIFHLEASLPLATSVRSLTDLFAQKGDVSFNLESSRLSIALLRPLFPKVTLPEAGLVTSQIAVTGSFDAPTVAAALSASGLSGGFLGASPPTDMVINLASAENQLKLSGTAKQPNAPPATLSGTMGFRPQRWLDHPPSLAEETIDLRLQIQGLNALHFAPQLPGVADFSVLLDADVRVAGRLDAPDVRGSITAREGRLRPKNDSLPTISALRMDLRFEGRKATLADLSMTHAGGTVSLRGTADFAILANPQLDLTLSGSQVLLWRDDSMNARANAALRLVGPYAAATLSGTLAIVETLYYRDLEIIPNSPFRSPRKRAVVARVDQILHPERAANRWNIPAPLNNWLVEVRLTTQDPVLLRGDRIGGSIGGDIRVRGTLGNPQLDGTAVLNDATVRLPFSTLQVPRGTLTFTPERGLDPILDLRGTSRISPYDVTIFVSGSASDPDVLLTSDPPLPENEILALLATGSTTRDLGTQALTLKAIQLFIEQIRRSRLPFGKQLGEFLGVLEEIDIRVGANDPYTGRRLSSATVGLTDRLVISVAIDEEGNSRGVLMYLFRFR